MAAHRWDGQDLELHVHVQPGARRSEVQGLHGDAIKIRVSAPAVEGAANRALLELISDAFAVPRGRCELVSGETSRRKRVRIRAPERANADRLLGVWTGSEKK